MLRPWHQALPGAVWGRGPYAPLYAPQPPLVPGLVNPSRLAAFEKNDVYKAGPDLGGHDSEMIGGAARASREFVRSVGSVGA